MKSITYHNYTEKEALEYTSKIVDFGVSLIVYAALNELLNAYVLVRESKYYRQELKRRVNNAVAMRNRKIEELKSLVVDKGFSETFWDSVIDFCEDDVANLKAEIKKTMDEANVGDSDLFSHVEVARVMIEAAKVQFEVIIKETTVRFRTENYKEMKNLNLFDAFHEFYIDNIYREWNIVCDILYRNVYKDVKLTNDRTVAAFETMANKFANGDFVNSCLSATYEDFPQYRGTKVVVEE